MDLEGDTIKPITLPKYNHNVSTRKIRFNNITGQVPREADSGEMEIGMQGVTGDVLRNIYKQQRQQDEAGGELDYTAVIVKTQADHIVFRAWEELSGMEVRALSLYTPAWPNHGMGGGWYDMHEEVLFS